MFLGPGELLLLCSHGSQAGCRNHLKGIPGDGALSALSTEMECRLDLVTLCYSLFKNRFSKQLQKHGHEHCHLVSSSLYLESTVMYGMPTAG